MARYLIDTHVFVYLATQQDDKLSHDVSELIKDYDNEFLMSTESVKELVVAYRSGNLPSKFFKSAEQMVDAIDGLFHIRIVNTDKSVMRQLARLEINEAQKHHDPSDHVIIAHAITLGIPLISNDLKFSFYRRQGLRLIENR